MSLSNIEISPHKFVDLYAESGINIGIRLTIQNVGHSRVFIIESELEPNLDSGYVRINSDEWIESPPGPSGLWAYSGKGSVVHVEASAHSFRTPGL